VWPPVRCTTEPCRQVISAAGRAASVLARTEHGSPAVRPVPYRNKAPPLPTNRYRSKSRKNASQQFVGEYTDSSHKYTLSAPQKVQIFSIPMLQPKPSSSHVHTAHTKAPGHDLPRHRPESPRSCRQASPAATSRPRHSFRNNGNQSGRNTAPATHSVASTRDPVSLLLHPAVAQHMGTQHTARLALPPIALTTLGALSTPRRATGPCASASPQTPRSRAPSRSPRA
jgi:hypothetical protein